MHGYGCIAPEADAESKLRVKNIPAQDGRGDMGEACLDEEGKRSIADRDAIDPRKALHVVPVQA